MVEIIHAYQSKLLCTLVEIAIALILMLLSFSSNLCNHGQATEARSFYGFQVMMENIHSEMYAKLIENLIHDTKEKHELFNAIETMPAVAKKGWSINLNNILKFQFSWIKLLLEKRIRSFS